jgi:6-phosphofructokinase
VITTVARNIGTECRAADPSAEDILLSRDLGFGAVRYLMEKGSGAMVSLKGSVIQPIPLESLVDAKTGQTAVRVVNTNGINFRVAQNYVRISAARDGPTDLPKRHTRLNSDSALPPSSFSLLRRVCACR